MPRLRAAQPHKAQHSHLSVPVGWELPWLCGYYRQTCAVSSLIALPLHCLKHTLAQSCSFHCLRLRGAGSPMISFPLSQFLLHHEKTRGHWYPHPFEDIAFTQTAWKHSKKEFKQGRKTRTRGMRDTKRGDCAHKPEERRSPSFQPLPAQHQLSQKSLSPNKIPAWQVQCQSG